MSLTAIDSLRHFAGKANELQLLRDRVEELEELLGLSREKQHVFWRLKLTPTQRAFISLLYYGGLLRRHAVFSALYGARLECDQPEEKILDVVLSKARIELSLHGICVQTQRGVGWFMTMDNKLKLRALIS